jgi:hypothetical protein
VRGPLERKTDLPIDVGDAPYLTFEMDAAKRAGTLSVVLDKFEPEPLPAHIVYAERKPVPLKLRAFLN